MQGQRAAVQLDEILSEHQPDARASDRLERRIAALVEPLENMFPVGLRDAYPGVRHLDCGEPSFVAAAQRNRDADMPVVGRELEGVGKQVVQHLLDFVAVELEGELGFGGFEIVVDAPALRLVGERCVNPAHERHELARAGVEFHLPVVELAQIHDLVDQPQQPFAVLPHERELLQLALVPDLFPEALYGAQDERKRGFEFVRYVGEETHLDLVQFFGLHAFEFFEPEFREEFHFGERQVVGYDDHHGDQHPVDQVCPPAQPPGRQDAHLDPCRAVAPYCSP